MEEKTKDFKYLPPNGYKQRCPLSHPTHPHTLSPQANQNPKSICFICGKQKLYTDPGFHYHCTICDIDLHSSCFDLPRKITHPFHLQHPLFFTFGKHGNISDGSNLTDNKAVPLDHPCKSSFYDNCTWCGNYIPPSMSNPRSTSFYRCSICSFVLDISCAQSNPPLTIETPKGHHHSLIFFPRPLLVPCDACGLVNASEPGYACLQCNYMVYQRCADLARVIKITRHPHRLSYSPFLSPSNSLCRVCYKTVDIKYGQYSCKEDGCSYLLHSRCATHVMVWDGKELEWEPEELGGIEDIASFKEVGDGLIEHFGHEHYLKLEKYDSVRDAKKQCQV